MSIVYSGLLLNLACGVGIVILNKYIVATDAFDYVIFLSFCHYLFTTASVNIMAKAGYIQSTQIPIHKRRTLAMVRTGIHEPHLVSVARLTFHIRTRHLSGQSCL